MMTQLIRALHQVRLLIDLILSAAISNMNILNSIAVEAWALCCFMPASCLSMGLDITTAKRSIGAIQAYSITMCPHVLSIGYTCPINVIAATMYAKCIRLADTGL